MYIYIRSFYGKESDFLRSTLTPRQERRPRGIEIGIMQPKKGGGIVLLPPPSFLLFPFLLFSTARFLVADPDAMAGHFLQHRPFQLSPIHRRWSREPGIVV